MRLIPVLLAWLLMLLVSIGNGLIRELTYGPRVDELAAHQISTLSGMLLIGLVIMGFVHRYPPVSGRAALGLGAVWMGLTIAFEFLFFHYVGGHPWPALLANYNLLAGRIWVVLLLWIGLAPYLFFRWSPGKP